MLKEDGSLVERSADEASDGTSEYRKFIISAACAVRLLPAMPALCVVLD